jgi:hypothetical protein
MSLFTPQNASRAIGVARVAFGLATVAAPARVGQMWLGEGGRTAPTVVALRAVAVREALIGMAVAHTASDPERGYRWARSSAIADLVDLAATVNARELLPRSGVIGTAAIATVSATLSIATSEWMRRSA